MKKRTLNELRQVKEFGWTPEPTEDLVKKLDDAIKTEISIKQDEVAKKLDMILDLEDIIRTEMVKAGLHPGEYPDNENEIYEAMKPSVQKNKKKYTRKVKHRKNEKENIK